MTSAYSEDDQRMIRLQEGDGTAFEELMSEWRNPLHRFFLRSTRDVTQTEDLLQDTFLRLYRNSWDYVPTGRFRGWLFRIANNLLVDHTRRARRDVLLSAVRRCSFSNGESVDAVSLLPNRENSPFRKVAQQEEAMIIVDLIDQLPDLQRRTFLLHYYESLSLSEVAEAMETSLPTSKGRLRLAKEKLRESLTARGFSPEMINDEDE
jgi:RNA polymerase sigma-70 factor, ECF subfamily